MRRRTIILGTIAGIMLVYYLFRLYAQNQLPLQITRDRVEAMLQQGDIQDAVFIYKENMLLITLTPDEIKRQPGSRFAIKLRDARSKEVLSGQSYASPVKQLFEI